METSHLGIIFFIIILICIYKMKSDTYQESFIVLDNEPLIDGIVSDFSKPSHSGSLINQKPYCPSNECPFYLLHDGIKYILFNYKKPITNLNPKYFNTHNEVKEHLYNLNCPIPKVRSHINSKTNDDPTVSYERECSKKISENNMGMDQCIYYAKDLSSLKKYYDIKQDKKNKSLFSYEQCMVDTINDELNISDEADLNYNKMILDIDQDMNYKSI